MGPLDTDFPEVWIAVSNLPATGQFRHPVSSKRSQLAACIGRWLGLLLEVFALLGPHGQIASLIVFDDQIR